MTNSIEFSLAATAHPRTEIVFIQAGIDGVDELVASIREGAEVHLLDAGGDGLAQMAQTLAGRSGIDAIHLVSHGSAGAISFGSYSLGAADLESHSAALAAIGSVLAPDADILLYGCDVGAGSAGAAFIDALAQATGADIAASTNLTGAAASGGDWKLEASSGHIDTPAMALTDYTGVLAAINPGVVKGADAASSVLLFGSYVDAAGNTYVTGGFDGSADFDPSASTFTLSQVNAGNLYDVYVAKYDPNGALLWAKNVGSSDSSGSSIYATSVIADSSGNVYLTGTVSGTVDLNPGAGTSTHTSAGDDAFVLKLDSSGAFLWDKVIGGASTDNGTDITLDASGNLYFAGNYSQAMTVDRAAYGSGTPLLTSLPSSASMNLFVAKMDATSGAITWIKGALGSGSDPTMRDIAVDASGNVFVTGTAVTSLNFNPGVSSASATSGAGDAFLWKLNSSGAFAAGQLFGSADANNQDGYSILIDGSGSLLVSGLYTGTVDFDFGAGVHNATAGSDYGAYLLKLDANFGFQNLVTWDGSTAADFVVPQNISLDASGNVLIAGYFSGSADFDPGAGVTSLSSTGNGVFFMKLNSAFAFQWAKRTADWDGSEAYIYGAPGGDVKVISPMYSSGDADPGAGISAVTSPSMSSFFLSQWNAAATGLANSVPAFVGGVTALSVAQNAGATSITGLLHASDSDSGQTLTWSQNSAPSHGTLSFSSATASSGGANITPGGTLTYTPAAGYAGTDSFVVQVSDGVDLATRTITVGVTPGAPGTADLVAASDTGASSTDNKTNAASLSFSGTSAAGDSSSTVRVFLDKNGNGAYDAGTDPTASATVSNGSWSVSGLGTSGLSDASYNVYAVITSATGSLSSATSSALSVTLDTAAPTATIVLSDSALKIGDTATATITFSEVVTGLTNADLTIANGTLGAVGSSDGGITWSATFTPTASVTDATNVITLNNTGVSDTAGNAGTGTTSSANYAIDTARPTVAGIVLSDSALLAGESATVTIIFSEAVTGLALADLTAGAGTLSALASADGGITWTATLTPNAGIASATNLVTLAGNTVLDLAGNPNVGATDSANYTVNTVRPTATVALSDSALIAGESSTVTIVFSEAVTGFSNADLTVANGVLGPVSSSDGGITWSATFTPTAGVTDATNVITLDNTGVANTAGNTGAGTTSSANYTIDSAGPTATIALDDSSLKIGDTATVTITFSEAVTGFSNADLTVDNGTLGAVSSVDGGVTWSATFTPAASVTDATNLITLDNTGVSDTAGNAGSGTTSSANYAIDTARPTVAGIVLSDSALLAGESATVTITFSEAVTGLAAADFSGGAGTMSALASADGGITWTATLTPSAATSSATNLVTLAGNAVADLAGNANVGATDSANYTVNTVRPGATVTVADNALLAGETSLVTIVFSEAVSGFALADLAAANGTLSALSTSDNITFTTTLTPGAATRDATNLVTLDLTGVSNLAGNAGAGTAASNNYAIDTVRPSATIVLDDTALKIGDTALVTIAFAEAVSGFSNADLTSSNGTLGVVSSSDGGLTWTATFTPAAGITDATNIISLDNAGVLTAAGNAGLGASQSANFVVDTLAPQASVTVAGSALAAGSTAVVTITFDAAVTGFTNADLSVANGTLDPVASLDGGITWTATLTPAAAVEDSSNLIALNMAGLQDAIGNPGSGSVNSNNYTVSTTIPTATIAVADNSLLAGETSAVAITFSQAVSGLTLADFSVANGALSALATADGGLTWSATLTPGASVVDATNLITLDNTGFASLGGSVGIGATLSNNYTIETTRPGAAIVVAQATLGIGQTSLVTITFTEPVTGFSNADLAFAGATLSPVASTDGGLTWTATLTPNADTSASSAIAVATSGVLDLAGNAGNTVALSNNYQVNTELAPSGPPVVLIDGAPSTTVIVTDPVTGISNVTLTVPIIVALDPDPVTGKPGVADIPLGIKPPPGVAHTDLLVSLPVGSGLRAEGPTILLNNPQAQVDLVNRVETHTDPATGERQDMRAEARGFFGALAADVMLETRTLTLSSGPNFPAGQPILIAGSSSTPAPGTHNASAIALVIDTTQLGANIVLQLDNVDFAGIVGAATIRGGAGRNHVAGDDAVQNMLMGADDDILAGGGGNDLLAGGAGKDRLDGGAGNDVLQGGRSDRGAWEFFIDKTGTLMARHELAVFQPGATETVALGELDKGVAGLGFLAAKTSLLTDLALLYQAAFGRAPDLGGLDFYARNFTSAQAVAKSFFSSAEWRALGNDALGDSAFIQQMYQQVHGRAPDAGGLAFWLAQLGGKSGAPMSRPDLLTAFALSPENRALHVDLVIGATLLDRETGWFAGSGDDRLQGGAGSDLIVGGDGVDTVVYSGKQADYRFLLTRDGQVRVEDKANGDLDTISGIEKGEFSNGTIDLSFTQANASSLQAIGLVYQVVFDRSADAGGIAFWSGLHVDTMQLASAFAGSAEFKARYGALDNAHFVGELLGNIGLGATTAGGAAYWEGYLAGHSRTDLVAALIGDAAVVNAQFGGQGLWLM